MLVSRGYQSFCPPARDVRVAGAWVHDVKLQRVHRGFLLWKYLCKLLVTHMGWQGLQNSGGCQLLDSGFVNTWREQHADTVPKIFDQTKGMDWKICEHGFINQGNYILGNYIFITRLIVITEQIACKHCSRTELAHQNMH